MGKYRIKVGRANVAPSEKKIAFELTAPPSRWIAEREPVAPEIGQKIIIKRGDRPLTFTEVIAAWRDDAAFRVFTCATLAAAPWPAFFWEMPPIRRGHTDAPYEFMLIRSDALACMPPDQEAFAAQFENTDEFVATFPNLGGDAILVAPKQIGPPENYAHLGAFIRSAPRAQQHELFQALGHAVDEFLKTYERRVWISTSGLGVAWLHIRLDTYPKYYQHQPYARA
jgi:hypothetical protein